MKIFVLRKGVNDCSMEGEYLRVSISLSFFLSFWGRRSCFRKVRFGGVFGRCVSEGGLGSFGFVGFEEV